MVARRLAAQWQEKELLHFGGNSCCCCILAASMSNRKEVYCMVTAKALFALWLPRRALSIVAASFLHSSSFWPHVSSVSPESNALVTDPKQRAGSTKKLCSVYNHPLDLRRPPPTQRQETTSFFAVSSRVAISFLFLKCFFLFSAVLFSMTICFQCIFLLALQ